MLLRFDKLIPVAAFSAFGIGNDAVGIQDMLDGRGADIITEILHGSGNSVIAPIGIPPGQYENLIDDIF